MKKLLIKSTSSKRNRTLVVTEAGGSTTELEGRQRIGLGQDLGMEQRLADVEVAAAEPVRPRPNAASFHHLSCPWFSPGRRRLPLRLATRRGRHTYRADSRCPGCRRRGRSGRHPRRCRTESSATRGPWALLMEVNDGSRRGLSLVKHGAATPGKAREGFHIPPAAEGDVTAARIT